MKRVKLLSLLLSLSLLLAACAGPAAPTGSSASPSPSVSPTDTTPSASPEVSRDTTVDFVVVGAGMAGLSAATEAAQQGSSVLLLEKLSFAGGSSALCEGYLWASGSQMNEACGIGYTPEKMKEFFKQCGGDVVVPGLIDNMVDVSGEIFDKLNEEGVLFSKETFTTSGSVLAPDLQVFVAEGAGSGMIQSMVARAEKAGVEIRYESPAVDLIVEDGAVAGVTVEDSEGTYQVRAGTTILATGGFLMNEEMMEEYMPLWAGLHPLCTVGATGDGHRMAIELGAQMIGDNTTGTWGWDGQNGYKMEGGLAPMLSMFITNLEGQRFGSELDPLKNANILHQTGRKAYCFFDSNSSYVQLLEQSVAAGLTVKADTLEELAQSVGMDADALLATVEAYNAAAADGSDAFGMPAAAMTPLTTAPYYMSILSPEIPNATLMGLKVNEFGQIVDGSDQPIPNLYGAGELILGSVVNDRYPTCGSCLGAGAYVGVVAVRHALGLM